MKVNVFLLTGAFLTLAQTAKPAPAQTVSAAPGGGAPAPETLTGLPAVSAPQLVCTNTLVTGLDNLSVRALTEQQGRAQLLNSLLTTAPTCKPTVCWLTKQDAASGKKSCKDATPQGPAVAPFSLAIFGDTPDKVTPKSEVKPVLTGQPFPTLVNPASKTLVVIYRPTGLTEHQDEAVLQIEWRQKDGTAADVTDKYFITGVAEAYQDARYRISIWAGVGYLYSANNFSQSFPELRAIIETRLIDAAQREQYCSQIPKPTGCELELAWKIDAAHRQQYCSRRTTPEGCTLDDKKHTWKLDVTNEASYCLGSPTPKECDDNSRWKRKPWIWENLRIYGDVGLSSTTALTTQTGTTPGGATTLSASNFTGAKIFDGSVAVGLGWSFRVASEDPKHDTNKFTVMFPIIRIGTATIAAQPGTNVGGPTPFYDSFGVRLENENGHFAGAYTEVGVGQSDRFVYQKSSRLKVEGFLPITSPGTVRLALRLQVDRTMPGTQLNAPPVCKVGDTTCTQAGNDLLPQAGDIKISLLFNLDVRTVFDLLGGPTGTKAQ